jgi:hypothetical protein
MRSWPRLAGTSSRVPEPHETFEHTEGFRFTRSIFRNVELPD